MLKNAGFIVFLIMVFGLISPYNLLAQDLKIPSISQSSDPILSEVSSLITVNTNLITFNVSVSDINGLAVTGLSKNNFNILDNKIPQEIHFFSDEDVPVSISIVFDTSGSMSGDKIDQAKKTLANFIQTSKFQDEFFLIDVGSKAQLLLNGTRDADSLIEKFTYVQPQGKTALYDAVNMGVERVKRGSYAKKIVLIISDGKDNNSRSTLKELKNHLKETDVIIYAIGVGEYYSIVTKGFSGKNILEELAAISGGKAFFPVNSVEMNAAFEQTALEIRHLYSIGYYPSDLAANGKNHRITVKIKNSDESRRLFIRSRKEYIFEKTP